MIRSDYLIFGSGIAGLTFAVKIAAHFPDKKVTIITKAHESESNTKYAQGGIAVVLNQIEDNFQKHIDDTLLCGAGLCDPEVVEMVVKNGPKCVQELIDWGTQFDTNKYGTYDLGREGGHSNHRVMHHKDQTGFEIERAILKQAHLQNNITILDYHFATDLIVQNNRCFGAKVLDEKTNEIEFFLADFTLLATGGIGQVYGHTTNPVIATGDGIAMAARANAKITAMEFIQFHPTALYNPKSKSTFLISEAVRGFGAILRNKKGKRFMFDYDVRGELASRDIVSQSIESELKKSGDECVFLDCTHLDMTAFKTHFPQIYERCRELNILIETNWIPVIPAQHYLCGGIAVDRNGKTSIANLFACGECSHTGLHGANRLASNSLLEAIVYSDAIFTYLSKAKKLDERSIEIEIERNEKPDLSDENRLDAMLFQLQSLMQRNVGITRHDRDLSKSEFQLKKWLAELSVQNSFGCSKKRRELQNMIEVGLLIVQHSMQRTQNKGSFVKI